MPCGVILLFYSTIRPHGPHHFLIVVKCFEHHLAVQLSHLSLPLASLLYQVILRVQHYFRMYFDHGEQYTLIIEGLSVSENIFSFSGYTYLVCLSLIEP